MLFDVDINTAQNREKHLKGTIFIARHHYSIELLKQNDSLLDFREKIDLNKVDKALGTSTTGHAVQKFCLESILGTDFINELSLDDREQIKNKYVAAPLVSFQTVTSILSGRRN